VLGHEITAASPSALRQRIPALIFEPVNVTNVTLGKDEKWQEIRETGFTLRDAIEYQGHTYALKSAVRAENPWGVTTRIKYAPAI